MYVRLFYKSINGTVQYPKLLIETGKASQTGVIFHSQ